ncbi:Protein of unknown function DUF668 [Macleaya cordata]|uniref:DUF3475 domain-containing protein n=1 Tax=Macleaya cordata TaxID=56857 RepID=A0A200QYR9_MACCD|nr:Protein of unknown function DUF668 [Macleaya cordata]
MQMWFSEIGNLVGNGIKRSNYLSSYDPRKKNRNFFRREKNGKLGILAFETAKTMSRLVSLYKSLSDDEILKLRNQIIRSEGIVYLNSKDEGFLLKLACAEKIEEIDRVAMTVSRLGKKCSDHQLNQFEHVYSDLKDGIIDSGRLRFASKDIKKIVKQMEKFINATSSLYSGLEILSEMEISEQRITQWKNYSRSLPGQKGNSDLFDQKISWQRQQVRYLRQVSLWGQTFNKIVSLMARTVCIVYTRICEAFAPYVSVLVLPTSRRHKRFFSETHQIQFYSDARPLILSPRVRPVSDVVSTKSGPISKQSSVKSDSGVRFWSRELKPLRPRCSVDVSVGSGMGFKQKNHVLSFGPAIEKNTSTSIRLTEQAAPSTVGGSGLALRFANVIVLTEKYMNSPCSIDDYGRENLYQMLPANLRKVVKEKLKQQWMKMMRKKLGKWEKASIVEEWQEKLKRVLGWLAPMAHDTVRWQVERSFEKQNFDAKPRVLLLQTLYFADKEKTEKTIVEVLVGLSCICRYGSGCSCMDC